MSQYECIYPYHFSEIFWGAMHATATSWDDWLWPGFYLLVGSRRWESAQYSSGPVCFYRKNHGAKYRPSGKLYILWTCLFSCCSGRSLSCQSPTAMFCLHYAPLGILISWYEQRKLFKKDGLDKLPGTLMQKTVFLEVMTVCCLQQCDFPVRFAS